MNKTIYKLDTNKNIRFLTIQILENSYPDEIIQISGIEGTENPVYHTKKCNPKNVGKKNETSASEQALKEAEAIIKDKLTKGYFEDKSLLGSCDYKLPMLAKEYKSEKHKINYEKEFIYVQPKLDGMRCLAHIYSENDVKLYSRGGKEIKNMNHIVEDLKSLAPALRSDGFPHILDGELYVHGEDFQTNMEFIKTYTPNLTERIQFNIYDKINVEETFHFRMHGLKFIEGVASALKLNSLYFIQSHAINNEDELKSFHKGYLKVGYEGTMIRLGDSLYKENSRSSGLLKYKDFQDIAIVIKDIIPCKVMTDWGEPIFDWPGAKGHRYGENILGSNTKLSHAMREEILKNKHLYVGKTAEVRFFEYSNTGVPRFPVMVGIRLDK